MVGFKGIVDAKLLWPMKHADFNRWQKKQCKTLSPNAHYVSSAKEYYRYMKRPIQRRMLSMSSLASLFWRTPDPKKPECGHELHTSATLEDFCPVCQVDHCIEFLGAITQAREKVGGPFRQDPEPRSAHPSNRSLRLAWRAARLELVNLVYMLESQAVIENRLDLSNPPATTDDEPVTNVYGAQAALERFNQRYKYPVAEAPHNSEEQGSLYYTPSSSPNKDRKVHFQDQSGNDSMRKNST